MRAVRHRGRWTPDDRAEAPYRYLPVDVPAGAPALRVRLSFDRSSAVLDLGCLAPEGFRGWSGGARDHFVITAYDATPGYLPGELEPGTWQVMLGLHRVPAEGIDYEVVAEVGPATVEPHPVAPPAPERRPRRDLPVSDDLTWLAGDLHAHTVHSDGALGIGELACLAASRGLDFLAVTDHNTVSHHPHLAGAGAHAGILLVPGQEVTTAWGHANAFGDIGWVDFRQQADEHVAVVARRGGLLSVNHPLAGDCSWRRPTATRPPLAEIWHSSWFDRRWGGPLAWWQAWDPAVTPVGGSDFHRPGSDALPGSPTTWVACRGGDVLAGLSAGRAAISAGYDAPVLVRVGGELHALDAEGTFLTGPAGRRVPVRSARARFAAEDGPHWLEDAETAVIAICG